MTGLRVLISGAGIAGPCLAFFLAQTGARITVLEKATSLLPHGQNVDIDGKAAQNVVTKMGLRQTIQDHHTTEAGSQFISPSGIPYALFPVRKGASASFTSEFEILRGDLAKIFWEATKDKENVEYRFGATIAKVISNSGERVTIELSDDRVEEYDLVVLSDGQWSPTRRDVFGQDSIKVIDKNMFGVYWTMPRIESDNDWWNIYTALRSRILTTRPDPYGSIRALVSKMPCNETERKEWTDAIRAGRDSQMELVRKEFADAGWQAERLIDSMEKAPDFYFQVVQQIKLDKWSRNRIVCLGDTAYAPSPLTGMGTSLAITGAYVLAGELSKLKSGEHPSQAFEAYEKAFRPFVEKVQELLSFIPGIAHPEHAWKRWLFVGCAWIASKVISIPWVIGKLQQEDKGVDFELPIYEAFESGTGEMMAEKM